MIQWFLLLLLFPALVSAAESGRDTLKENEILFVVPVWKGYTNEDGTGLYHELLNGIFAESGIKVVTRYYPISRALMLVKKDHADVSGAILKPEGDKDYAYTSYPIYSDGISAFFHKDKLPDWAQVDTIKANLSRAITPPEISDIINLGVDITMVKSRKQCLLLVVARRKDYCVDLTEVQLQSVALINETAENIDGQNVELDLAELEQYVTRYLAAKELFIVFPKTPKGQKLAELYDKGYVALRDAGKLRQVYEKWNLTNIMPRELAVAAP